MSRNEKIKTLVNYIVDNVPDDGNFLVIEWRKFIEITGISSTGAFMISKYAAISSIDMPDNIVMEVCPIEGSLRSRIKMSYGFRKIDNISDYEITECNFRRLTDNDIKTLKDIFVNVPGIDNKKLLIIMLMVDVLITKNSSDRAWLRVKPGYISSSFMVPENIVNQYFNILKESGILIESVHPFDNKTLMRFHLECVKEPSRDDDLSTCVIGFSTVKNKKLNKQLNQNIQKNNIDISNEKGIIENKDTANVLLENETENDQISNALKSLSQVIGETIRGLEEERDELKTKLSDYSSSSIAFQALNKQYKEIVSQKEEIESSYTSPKEMTKIKKSLLDKCSFLLNKMSSDIIIQLADINNGIDINTARRNIMTMTLDAAKSIENYIKNAEKIVNTSQRKDDCEEDIASE